jgi:peptidoglycan/LPS O-acetylase OafA/YrhL
LAHEPALDGLRGLALLVMLAYHGELGIVPGAYFTLSAFFALSGYLITALLLAEHADTGRVDLRAFWGRRFRRLVPGALVGLVAVVVFGALLASGNQLAELRGDVISGASYVANWHFIADGRSYADVFAAPSPVQHYWSLAVEEQFYLVFPLLAVGLLMLAGRRRRSGPLTARDRLVLGGALLSLTLASTVWMAIVHTPGTERAYYGTDARAGEFLLGAFLAVVLAGREPRHRRAAVVTAEAVGGLALLATIALWATVPISEPAIYRGGFLLAASLAALVIVAVRQHGPVSWVLSRRLLCTVGVLSYSAYVLHWPVFLWLSPARTGWDPWPLFGVRLALTFALAALSHHLLEQPIRLRQRLPGRRALPAALAVASLLVVGAIAVTVSPPPPELAFTPASEREALPSEPPPPVAAVSAGAEVAAGDLASGSGVPAAPLPPLRILVVGDSVAYNMAEGLEAYAAEPAGSLVVWNRALPGCATGRGGLKRYAAGEGDAGEECARWEQRWPTEIERFAPDVILVGTSPWDAIDRQIPALGETWRHVGDPTYDGWLRHELVTAQRTLRAAGTPVVWFSQPHIDRPRTAPENDPARIDRLNEVAAEALAGDPGTTLADYAGWIDDDPQRSVDRSLRVDGVHLGERGRRDVAEWLAPQLLTAAGRDPGGS